MVEDTDVAASNADGEETTVTTLAEVPVGENVRKAGSDVKRGDLILSRGQAVSSVGGEIGSLAFVGRQSVSTYRQPRVAVISTGDELVDLHASTLDASIEPDWSGIFDSNRPSLLSVLQAHHFTAIDGGIVKDTRQATAEALRRAASEADVIITTGGTSMGEADFLKPVLEEELGGTIHFGRVAMKPGKPSTFATLPSEEDSPATLVFGLPGNPASCLVTLHIFVLPALRKMAGYPSQNWHLPTIRVQVGQDKFVSLPWLIQNASQLESPAPLDPRPEFQRVTVRAQTNASAGSTTFIASTTGYQRSSRTVSLAAANALLKLPSVKDQPNGRTEFDKGEAVDAVLIGPIC